MIWTGESAHRTPPAEREKSLDYVERAESENDPLFVLLAIMKRIKV